MKVDLLEFNLGDKILGIRTDFVKSVFEIEEVELVHGSSGHVIGLVKHSEQVYPLVCPARLVGTDTKPCKSPIGKIAIAVSYKGKVFALLADSILRIEEVEKKIEETSLDFHKKEKETIIEISPELIEERLDVPLLMEKEKKEHHVSEEELKIEVVYLIFRVGRRLIAIPAEKVRKVEEIDSENVDTIPTSSWVNKVCILADKAMRLGDLRLALGEGEEEKGGNYVVIIGKGNKQLGIVADDIVDLLPTYRAQISQGSEDEMFSSFFNYKGKLVYVLSEKFLDSILEQSALEVKTEDRQIKATKEKEILVVRIGTKKFAVKMENVLGILNYGEVKITSYPTTSPYIKGIVVTSTFSHLLYDVVTLLGEKVEINDETKILVFKDEDCEGAILISEIEDLFSVPEERIFYDLKPHITAGAVLSPNGETANLLNLKFIALKACQKVEP